MISSSQSKKALTNSVKLLFPQVILSANSIQTYYRIRQGLLKIWTEHSHWFSVNLKPLKISWPKFQHCYNYKRNEFSPNLEVVAQKIGLLRPFEVLNVFGGKSISLAPRAFIFGEKRVSIEMHKWWNFGVDISNHFPAIQNWPFCLSNSNPHDA